MKNENKLRIKVTGKSRCDKHSGEYGVDVRWNALPGSFASGNIVSSSTLMSKMMLDITNCWDALSFAHLIVAVFPVPRVLAESDLKSFQSHEKVIS